MDVLRRVGQYIDNVHLFGWYFRGDDDDDQPARAQHCESVLRCCVNVTTLTIEDSDLTRYFLRTMWKTIGEVTKAKSVVAVVVGSDGEDMDDKNGYHPTGSMSSSTRNNHHTASGKKTGKNRFFRDGPRLAIFSDYLTTLDITLAHKTCEHAMHWLGLAARNGRLQSLKNVKFSGRRPKWKFYQRHKQPRLRLSLLLLFLRSLPRLKGLTLGQGDIYDDFPDALVDAMFPPPSEEYIKRPAAAEPKKTSSSSTRSHRQLSTISLETLQVCEFDSHSALVKLLERLPALSLLMLGYLDGVDYLDAVRRFVCQGQRLSLRITKQVASSLTEDDWAKFFGDHKYDQSSFSINSPLESKLSLPDEPAAAVITPRTATPTTSKGGLSLNFGYSTLNGITNKVAKIISQSPIMSHQLTGIHIYRASNLSHQGVAALLYSCPNLGMLSLEYSTIFGIVFQNSIPWACRDTLFDLTLRNLHMGNRGQEFAAAARHHIRQLSHLTCLDLGGSWVLADMIMDSSDMGRGERLYTQAGEQDRMVWPKLNYFGLRSPERYVDLPEFKVMLSMFPMTTRIELWAFNTSEVDEWIKTYRPDLIYILYSGDYNC
ncbi:hypothetical protein BGZ96_000547 [Linnemannia gamsii]|uniref:F-box domain-containing protein n=1 Tax=Linnemannia gamsii TaxID=64522 RepID=A0ABQ7JNT0_9FUNG|nr:hypothetical protein BGZ96_000547 [Linnemannia gamsii]